MHTDFSTVAPTWKASISIGVIGGDASINDLVMKADMAMYKSKSEGKNRTTVYNDREDLTFHMKV